MTLQPKLQSLQERAKSDLYFFCREILGYTEMTVKPHLELCGFVTNSEKKKRLMLLPRGSFKSSCITIGYTLWRIVKDPNIRVLISSETFNQAKTFLRAIKTHIEQNPVFKEIFGDLVGEEIWRQDEIMVKGKTRSSRESTLMCSGVGQTKVGMHYDLIILDDVVSDRTINTQEQLQKTITHYKLLLSILDPGRELNIIGCLDGNSNITMGDGTVKKLKEIKESDYVWSIDKELSIQKKKVLKVIPQGKSDVVELCTGRNKITCTANHPFLSVEGDKYNWKTVWKKAEDLKADDYIVSLKNLNLDYRKRIFDNKFITNEQAWFFGFIVGDGWFNKNGKSYYLSVAKSIYPELNSKVKKLMEKYFKGAVYDTKHGYYRITSKLAKIFFDLDFKIGAKQKEIPAWVFKTRACIKRNFLMGLIDADGWKNSHGHGFSIEVVSKKLVEDIQLLAQECCVRTTNITSRKRTIKAPNSPVVTENEMYHIGLVFESPRLVKNKNVFKNFKREGVRVERVFSVIKKTEQTEVYDLTIEDNENFVANGFFVHNTRYSFADLYGHILSNDSAAFDVLVRSAYNEDGTLFFPTRLTRDYLEAQKKAQGSQHFSNQYLNLVIDQESAAFKQAWIKFYSQIPDGLRYFMTVDPASTQGKYSDFTGLVVAGIDSENNIYVVEARQLKVTIGDMVNFIFSAVERYDIDKYGCVGIEVNANQQTYKYILNEEMIKRGKYFAIRELMPSTQKSKANRIMGLQPWFENGKIYIKKSHYDLYEQLIHYPRTAHDDVVDALCNVLEVMAPGEGPPQTDKYKDSKLSPNEIAEWKNKDECCKPRKVVRKKQRW